MNDYLKALRLPFAPEHITFKPGKATQEGTKCMAMPYGDLRAYLNRLDEVCGPDWSVEYQPWGESRIIARLTIGGVTRCSTGEMDAQDEKQGMGGTVAEAQSLKRACAMFGLGRYLYELPNSWVEFDPQRKRITEQGQRELDRHYRAWYTEQMASLCPWTQWEGPASAYSWAVASGYATCEEHAQNALKKVVEDGFGGAIKQSNWGAVAEAFYHNRLQRQEEKVAA